MNNREQLDARVTVMNVWMPTINSSFCEQYVTLGRRRDIVHFSQNLVLHWPDNVVHHTMTTRLGHFFLINSYDLHTVLL